MENTETKKTYDCIEQDCGRKFDSKEKLIEHYSNRHPGVEYKENKQETIKDNSTILKNLYGKIHLLESVIEKETIQQYNLDNMPNYDILNSSSSSENETKEKKVKTAKDELREMLQEPISNVALVANDDNTNSIILPNKVIEVSDEMIGIGTKFENYLDIKDIDLSRHHLAVFRDQCNIGFSNLSEVVMLNLSFNWLTYSYDIRFFSKLQQLFINDNKIDDISFCECLPQLEVLNAENNNICDVSPLVKCSMLQVLRLGQNKIKYENSTLKTIYYLKNLRELTINDNPFLNNIFGYTHLFIYKFPWILVLDKEKIEDINRDIAKKFTIENNPVLAQFRPNTARPTTNINLNDKDNDSSDTFKSNNEENNKAEPNSNSNSKEKEVQPTTKNQTQTQFRVGDTIITKIETTKQDKPKLAKKRLPQINPELREVNDLKRENKELKDKIERQEKEIHTLKLQLENMSQINKENEIIITKYKQEKSEVYDEGKVKLLHQMEVWKKEYVDLLDKTGSTNNTSATMIIDNRARPQTAQVKTTRSADFDQVIEQLKSIKRKNILDDSLYEESSEEQSNQNDNEEDNDDNGNDNEDIKQIESPHTKKKTIEDKDNDNNDNDDDFDSDAEIDELCRKSYQNLQEIRSELKEMEKQYDQNQVIPPSNTISNITPPISKLIDPIQNLLTNNANINKPVLTKNIKLTSVARNKSLPKETKDETKLNINSFRKK